MKLPRITTLIFTTLLCAGWSIKSQAQQPVTEVQASAGSTANSEAQQPAPKAVKPEGRVIEEIIVTANKIEMSVQDIAGSLLAITGEYMREANVDDFHELASYLPNFMITETGADPEIAIRGVQTTNSIGGGDNSVGLVIEDISMSRQNLFNMGFFDLQRVEVLRGPQGTLFGKSTTAGVVNLITNPPTDEFSGYLTARQGEKDQQLQGAISGPLLDSLSGRLSFIVDRPGSKSTNTFNDDEIGFTDLDGYRLKLRWSPTESTDVNLFFNHSSTDGQNANQNFVKLDEASREYLAQFDPRIEGNAFDQKQSFDAPSQFWIHDGLLYGLRLDTDWGDPWFLNALSTTAVWGAVDYRVNGYIDVDLSPADVFRNPVSWEDIYIEQLEFRMQGTAPGFFSLGGGEMEFVSGIFLQQEDIVYDYRFTGGSDFESYAAGPGAEALGGGPRGGLGFIGVQPPPGVGASTTDDGVAIFPEMDSFTQGIFAQFIYRPIEPLAITVGLRYDRIDRDAIMPVKRLHPSGNGDLSLLAPVFGAPEDITFTPKIRERESSSKLSLQYEFLGGDVVSYVTWDRGFKGGAFNFFAFAEGAVLQADPEFVDSYEVGLKSVLFDQTLSLNLSVYDSQFTDLHVYVVREGAVLNNTELSNASEVRASGVEVDGRFLPGFASWLTLSGAVAYSHARFVDYSNGPNGDLSGKTLINAPDWSALFTPEVRLPVTWLGDDVGIALAIDAVYTDHFFTVGNLNPEYEIPSKLLFNGRITLAPASGPWSVALAVANIADKRVLVRHSAAGLWPGSETGRVGPRRHTSLDFTWAW